MSSVSPPRAIISFRQDGEGHWVAELECGHSQHMRHQPPWQLRPWVLSEAGRARFVGTRIPCTRCAAAQDGSLPHGAEVMDVDPHHVEHAIALARSARQKGNHPFGALLVLDGRVVAAAENTVMTGRDPTAHAETNLVAAAIAQLTAEDLRRSVLYTSCEPCAMCVGKIYWAGIRSVVYALSTEALAEMAGGEFVVPCRELFARAREQVAVAGPIDAPGAREVHVGYWK